MQNTTPVCDSWFVTRKINDSLYCINEVHYWEWNRANLWLIKGQTQDLLIDTGLGVASLRQHIAENHTCPSIFCRQPNNSSSSSSLE